MNEKVKSIFDFFKSEEPKKETFSEVVTVDGITLMYDGELAVGTPVFVLDAQNNEIPAPEGDFQIEMEGTLFVISVDVNGVIVDKQEVMQNEEEPQAPEMMSKDEFNEIITKVINDTLDKFSALEQKLEALLNQKESKFKDERKKVEEFKTLSVKEILTKK